jgi:hypothetical protein
MAMIKLLLIIIISTIASTTHAVSLEPEISIGTDQNFLIFKSDSQGFLTSEATFRVSGGSADARISLSLSDLMVNSSGVKELLPLGATPTSPKGNFRLISDSNIYIPNGEVQSFKAKIISRKPGPLQNIISGGLRITVTPSLEQGRSQLSRAVGIVLTFVYSPDDSISAKSNLEINNSQIEFSNPSTTSAQRLWLPELPQILSAGPVQLNYIQENTGNIFGVVTDSISIRRMWDPADQYLFQGQLRNRLLLPGQKMEKQIELVEQILNSNRTISLLGWGIYEVEINSIARIGNVDEGWYTSKSRFLILPWKQISLGLLILGALFFLQKLRKKMLSKAKLDSAIATPILLAPASPAKKKAVVKKAVVKKAVVKKAVVKKAVKTRP